MKVLTLGVEAEDIESQIIATLPSNLNIQVRIGKYQVRVDGKSLEVGLVVG